MTFKMVHNNINVFDLEKSVAFYKTALGMREVRRKEAADGSFILVFLEDGLSGHEVELTWLRDRKEPYNLGDNEVHMAVVTEDIPAALAFHEELNCVCYKNWDRGVYFISDPDGYWIEVIPAR